MPEHAPNEPPEGPLDIPAREDAFFTYCASLIAGGIWWGGPAWSALAFNQSTDFDDLDQLALGAPLGHAAELVPHQATFARSTMRRRRSS